MTGSTTAIVIIPIVIAVALAAWVLMVYHANHHPPGRRRGVPPDREVTGGTFQGEGLEVMPRRDAPPQQASSVRNADGNSDSGAGDQSAR